MYLEIGYNDGVRYFIQKSIIMITFFNININIFLMILAILVLVFTIIFSRLYRNYISPFIVKLCDKTKFRYNNIIVQSFCLPTTMLIVSIGIYCGVALGLSAFHVSSNETLDLIGNKVIRIGIIMYFTWGLFNCSDIFSELIHNLGAKIDISSSKMASKFLEYVYRFVILSISVVLLIGEFGFDVNGLLAGLGLGGLTVALAAQDSASNFFSGVVLIFGKPFEAGDWVKAGSIEGSVEEVTFRSTRIRALDGSINVIPNSKVTAEPIVSYTDLKNRFTDHRIAVEPNSDIETLKQLLADIEEMLGKDERLLDDSVIVRLMDFTTYGIVFRVAYSTHTADYLEFLEIRHSINFEILNLINKHQIKLTLFHR